MKIQLHLFFTLLVTTISFSQNPVVANPALVTAADNSLTISASITPNGSAQWSIIYSEDAFFTPSVTFEINNIATITGTTAQTVNYTIPCLNYGDQYYIKVKAINANGTTTSGYTNMATTGSVFNALPKLDAISFTPTTNAAVANLTIKNTSSLSVTGTLNYGLSETTMTNTLPVPTTSTNNATTTVNLSSLAPSTTYYVRVNLTNSAGCTKSVIYQFTTLTPVTLLYHFPFNGSTSSVTSNSGTFVKASGTNTFVSDGLGNNSGALNVIVEDTDTSRANNSYIANLPLLPQARTDRSINLRLQYLDNGTGVNALQQYICSWGAATTNQSYGFSATPSNAYHSIWGNDRNVASAVTNSTWYNITITFDGAIGFSKYYLNGVQIGSGVYHSNTNLINTNGTNCVLGRSLTATFGNGKFNIDDLKIYSGLLTQSEITALSTSDFNTNNLKFSLYPNPANNIVNIELTTELKSVEIYSLQGQKVLTSNKNQVDVSGLSKGIYMVRVEDVDNGVSTQKMVKE